MSDFLFFVSVVGLGVVLLLGGIGACTYTVDKSRCSEWGVVTGRETKFEKTTAITWDCFTRDSDGTWLPITQVRDIG